MFRRTFVCFRNARITIPKLSPTHTKARIVRWCIEDPLNGKELECYDPLFILQCSPDLVTAGYRVHENHQPLMIVEAHDEGILKVEDDIELGKWYHVGKGIGSIDDGEDDTGEDSDWLWQAYSHSEAEEVSS